MSPQYVQDNSDIGLCFLCNFCWSKLFVKEHSLNRVQFVVVYWDFICGLVSWVELRATRLEGHS